jgi:hypothetical protein
LPEKDEGKGKGKAEVSDLHQHGALVQGLDKFFKLQSSLLKLKEAHPVMYPFAFLSFNV